MNDLKLLQARIKGSRLYTGGEKKIERLYFTFRRQQSGSKINTWFEVVNDHIRPFAQVIKYRDFEFSNPLFYDERAAEKLVTEIYNRFRVIITDCELARKKTPLHERLKDDIVPIYDDRNMKVSALYGDVGTMKSKIAINLCVSRFTAGQIKKVLVFLPVSTKRNFQEQIDTWCSCPQLEWKLIGEESMGSSTKAVFDALKFVDNETQIVIDESHMIKNPLAKRSKRIKMICDKASFKLLMTGTPVTENVHNLYMQYACLSDLIIGVPNWLKFEEKYLIVNDNGEIIAYKNLEHLLGLIEPYTYQIDASVLNLPARTTVYFSCHLSFEQQKLYNYEKELLIEKIKDDNVCSTDIFKTFSHMQQITSGFYRGKKIESYKIHLLRNVNLSQKVVFFCKYLIEVDMLVDYLGEENCAVFTGKNPKKRDNEKDSFVNGDKKYFVATMQSGGTGLNGLQTVCDTVVFFSQSFSYFHRKQSIGRLERKGQNNSVTVIDIRTSSKIDDRIMSCIARKNNLADEIKSLINNKTKLKKYVEEL